VGGIRIGRWLLLTPAAACLALLCAAIASLLAVSLSGADRQWLGHYHRFLSDPTYLSYVTRSFRVAAYTTGASLILGYAIAYVMVRASGTVRRVLMLALVLQFFSVNVTRIYSLILLLGNNGAINRSLMAAGFIAGPIPLIYNELGVTIGLVSASLPFAVFPISTVLGRIPPSLKEAAGMLGAGRTRIFWRITFPLSLPGVNASVVIVFLYSLGSFATPLLLGGGFVDLIAVFSYEQAVNLSQYGFAAAGAVVTLACAFVTVYAVNRFFEWRMRVT
jgi:ABC-type spermidine/putrescine transport system permease subunit I